MERKNEYRIPYVLDFHGNYTNYTNSEGNDLLQKLRDQKGKCLEIAKKIMENSGFNVEEKIRSGREIYAKKNSMNERQTWSEEEYNDIGFRYTYLNLKGDQRFVEIYNLLWRADKVGALTIPKDKKNIRILSLGGGPGFELFAAKEYFHDFQCELVSMDIESGWEPYANALGNKFIHKDINSPDLLSMIKGKYDIVILSLVLGQHFLNLDILSKLITDCNLIATLVNSRFERLNELYYLTHLGAKVVKLLEDEDDRQAVILPIDTEIFPKVEDKSKILFPNVPYEEAKIGLDRTCTLGRKCKVFDCKLKHPIEKKMKCKYEANCYNFHCYLSHPPVPAPILCERCYKKQEEELFHLQYKFRNEFRKGYFCNDCLELFGPHNSRRDRD